MKKRLLSILCALAIVLGMVVPSASHVHAAEESTSDGTVCEYCGSAPNEWVELTADTVLTPGNHYYLSGDVDKGLIHLNTKEEGGTYCLDLAGHKLSSSKNRVFFLVKASDGDPVVFNIMDSSAEKSGRVEGFWGGPNNAAGVVYIQNGATMNVYGGTFTTTNNANTVAKSGGVFQVIGSGTLNMYGGSIVGGTVVENGGAVCVSGTFNMSGGTITGGSAASGNCVYVGSGADMKLSGDASIEEIYFGGNPAADLTISGTYTGTTALRLSGSVVDGSAIAISDNADISTAKLTVVGSDLTPTVSGSSIMLAAVSWCEACKRNVTWQKLSDDLPADASGHYRLSNNVDASQVTLKNGNTICLDLAGYTYTSGSRAFIIGVYAGTDDVMNIMDSSKNQTGKIQGYGGSKAYAAGVIYSYQKTKVNIYSGTIEALGSGDVVAGNGGALDTYGIINMYGGKVIGNRVAKNGGAICLIDSKATLNLEGGVVVSGTADLLGDCVYVADGATVKLSGDASPEQIYFAGSSADKFTINGMYTGTTELAFATTPAEGADIGNSSNAEIYKENITIAGTTMCAAVSGTNLVTANLVGASVTDSEGNVTYYDTLKAAAAACKSGNTIKLLADNSEDVTIADATLDLFGWDLKGNITVTGKLQMKDSATDDFTVNDAKGYGVVTGTVTGDVTYAADYLPLQETNGTSYHKYVLKLSKVSLRPGNSGIYYTGDILVDEAVQEKIDRYGVAVSTNSETPTADPADTTSLYTAFTKEQYGTVGTASVLISGIMGGKSTDAVNAATFIYGRPYILFDDGNYFYGKICATNMQQLTELVDKQVGKLTLPQFRALSAMYDSYETTVSAWNVPNMNANALAGETAANDRVLKVLVIGNSHGLDSTNLLYEVFKEEGLPAEYDDLVLGAIYTGGCSVSTHAKNALNDLTYDYWVKNDGSTADGSWIKTEDPTTREVLEDENWDVVLLQEMNTSSAREEYFTNDNIETVFTFVVNTLGYEPEFMWNMIWANPEIPESYVNYLYKDGDDGSGGEVGSGSEGDDNDTSDAATIARQRAWIFQTQQPGALETWGKNYVKLWENNRQVMYNNIVSNVHNYVVGKEVHNIGMDDVMVNATAIQYAIEWMGMHEQDMYRDYTHVSDLGRLTVSYLWYAKLTGKTSIGDPKYTLVSQTLENSRQPLGYAKDYSIYSDVIKNSVNFALADLYGVIQNLTYAEYLALSADEQAAYEASFESFSVHSGWTFDMWLEQAVAGVTYTDYARMTADQKTAYAALRDDFDTWYAGVAENLGYAEYFILTEDEKTAYAALRGDDFDTWLAKASAAFTYTDYVMLTYDQQNAYKKTFADGEFDTLYESWCTGMTYEEFMNLTMHQKLQYRKTYSSIANFLVWYNAAKAAYESANA